ncbi:hypothetical protein D3C76_1389470 [compost metagenome]
MDSRQIDALVRLQLPAVGDAAANFGTLGRHYTQLNQSIVDQDPVIRLHHLGHFGIVDRDLCGVPG